MYQALYRKYRSRTFDEVVGQKSVTQTLKAQVMTGRLSHAYLLTGIRGTGKTSCAKILARAVNCENPVDGNPCNCCRSCRSIESGACLDVQEIDAASNNGVEQVRTIRDEAVYTPSEVKKRVYIIDEVHMLSISAFNALLKILEEPPEHLIFILATTEADKVPPTILSRCQRFTFRRLQQEDIRARLDYVAYQEGIDLEPEAAEILARLADGGLRDGLSLLDQCASSSVGTVDAEAVYRCLGLAGARASYEMMSGIADRNTEAVLKLFNSLYEQGKDVRSLLSELSSVARDLLIMKTVSGDSIPMLSGLCTGREADTLAARFSRGELLRMVSMLQELLAGRAKTLNIRVDAELCLIRLCNPVLQSDSESFNARLTRLEEQIATGAYRPAAAPENGEAQAEAPEKPGEPMFRERMSDADQLKQLREYGLPDSFWPEFCRAMSEELDIPAKSQFHEGNRLQVCLESDTVYIIAGKFESSMLSKPEVLAAMTRKARALLNSPVRVLIRSTEKYMGGGKDRMPELLAMKDILGDRLTITD